MFGSAREAYEYGRMEWGAVSSAQSMNWREVILRGAATKGAKPRFPRDGQAVALDIMLAVRECDRHHPGIGSVLEYAYMPEPKRKYPELTKREMKRVWRCCAAFERHLRGMGYVR